MEKLLKYTLLSAAGAGTALLGWKLVQAASVRPEEVRSGQGQNGDMEALSDEQKERLVEELEAQL